VRAQAAVEDHADELHVLAHGGIEAVAAHVHRRRVGQHEVAQRRELAAGRAVMDHRAPRLHRRAHLEADVGHAQRLEQALAHHLAQARAAQPLDDAPQPVDVDAVGPGGARLVQQHRADRLEAAGDDGRDVARGAELQVVLAEELVAQARGVQQQVVDRDAPLRATQARLAVGIEALEHLQRVDLRHMVAGGVGQVQPAFLDQLQGQRRGHRLGGREDREHRVQRHRGGLAQFAHAGGAGIDLGQAVGDHRDDAGHAAVAVHGLVQQPVQGGLECVVGHGGRSPCAQRIAKPG
jgi:hypothetical protein